MDSKDCRGQSRIDPECMQKVFRTQESGTPPSPTECLFGTQNEVILHANAPKYSECTQTTCPVLRMYSECMPCSTQNAHQVRRVDSENTCQVLRIGSEDMPSTQNGLGMQQNRLAIQSECALRNVSSSDSA
jgi:hypothetical protein